MRNKIKLILMVLIIMLVGVMSGCKGQEAKNIVIAIPNDSSNEARALLMLDDLGYIELSDEVNVKATIRDIVNNPYNIEFKEMDATQIPNVLADVDYAVINPNPALSAGLNPSKDALKTETDPLWGNVLVVKEERKDEPVIKALAAAIQSQKVADFINDQYNGALVSTVENVTDGYDASIDYDVLAGQTIRVGGLPNPNGEILKVVKDILAEKNITLEIVEFNDFIQPNNATATGEIDANYYQHIPFMNDFNDENSTNLTAVCHIHVGPMGLYGGRQKTLDVLDNVKVK